MALDLQIEKYVSPYLAMTRANRPNRKLPSQSSYNNKLNNQSSRKSKRLNRSGCLGCPNKAESCRHSTWLRKKNTLLALVNNTNRLLKRKAWLTWNHCNSHNKKYLDIDIEKTNGSGSSREHRFETSYVHKQKEGNWGVDSDSEDTATDKGIINGVDY